MTDLNEEAQKWVYDNTDMKIIENRFFIMYLIENDLLKKSLLNVLYKKVKEYNSLQEVKISEKNIDTGKKKGVK